MKAEEARKQSFENAKAMTEQVRGLIQQAVYEGQLSVLYDMPLNEATAKILADEGYAITNLAGTNTYDKKWRVKISWE